jgi:hypothetical protein
MAPTALLPLRSRATFIAIKDPPSSARFELANLGSNGKHDSHCTTETTIKERYFEMSRHNPRNSFSLSNFFTFLRMKNPLNLQMFPSLGLRLCLVEVDSLLFKTIT